MLGYLYFLFFFSAIVGLAAVAHFSIAVTVSEQCLLHNLHSQPTHSSGAGFVIADSSLWGWVITADQFCLFWVTMALGMCLAALHPASDLQPASQTQ